MNELGVFKPLLTLLLLPPGGLLLILGLALILARKHRRLAWTLTGDQLLMSLSSHSARTDMVPVMYWRSSDS